jgi:hypothetical protein
MIRLQERKVSIIGTGKECLKGIKREKKRERSCEEHNKGGGEGWRGRGLNERVGCTTVAGCGRRADRERIRDASSIRGSSIFLCDC